MGYDLSGCPVVNGCGTMVKHLKRNSKLNICMFGHKRIPSREGGIEVVVEELAARMVCKGHSVTCYNRTGCHIGGIEYDTQIERQYKGIQIKRVPTIEKRGLAAVSSSFFAACCSAVGRYDIVHIHAEGPAFFSWIPWLFGKKVVVTIHGLDWKRAKWKDGIGRLFIRFGEKIAVKFAKRIIVLSESAQQYFTDVYGIKTCLIPNGVTISERAKNEQIDALYGLKSDSYILYLGRIVPEKGVHYLVRAFQQVNTDKKLVIAGSESDTKEYMCKLKKITSQDQRIIFTGFVQGRLLRELYSNAYFYCLPSDVEGMPISLMEAMSYGSCCLTSDIPECKNIVGNYGMTFQRGNIEDLQNKLQYLCDHKEIVNSLRNGASEYICAKYNWDKIVDDTLNLYNSIIRGQKRYEDIDGQ